MRNNLRAVLGGTLSVLVAMQMKLPVFSKVISPRRQDRPKTMKWRIPFLSVIEEIFLICESTAATEFVKRTFVVDLVWCNVDPLWNLAVSPEPSHSFLMTMRDVCIGLRHSMVWEKVLSGSQRIAVIGGIEKDKVTRFVRHLVPAESQGVLSNGSRACLQILTELFSG